jgi:hypothetical protein
MTDYDAFDDVKWNGPFVSSRKAYDATRALATKHGLGFLHNPGGGEFTGPNFRCQVTTLDDVLDYETLRDALKARP